LVSAWAVSDPAGRAYRPTSLPQIQLLELGVLLLRDFKRKEKGKKRKENEKGEMVGKGKRKREGREKEGKERRGREKKLMRGERPFGLKGLFLRKKFFS